MSAADTPDFFISYTTSDRRWAEWVAWQLEAAGHRVILQSWDFRPGQDFLHEMQEAVTSARRTVAILSPEYFESRYGEAEWRAVYAKDVAGGGRTLVPVRVRETELPGLLATRIFIDLVGKDAPEARRALLDGVSEHGIRPTEEPHFPGGRKPPFPARRRSARHWLVGADVIPDAGTAPGDNHDPPDCIWIDCDQARDEHGVVVMRTSTYSSLAGLLDDLYINYLSSRFAPYTYGSQWILTVDDFVIVAPLEWIGRSCRPISEFAPTWMQTRDWRSLELTDWGLSRVQVRDPAELRPCGMVSDDRRMRRLLRSNPKAVAAVSVRPASRAELAASAADGHYLVLHDWMGTQQGSVVTVLESYDDLPQRVRRV